MVASGESIIYRGRRKKREIIGKKVGSTETRPVPDTSGTLSCAETESAANHKDNVDSAKRKVEQVNALGFSKVTVKGGAKQKPCNSAVDCSGDDDSDINEYGVDSLKGAWKTTDASRLCVVIVRAVRSDGKSATMWKPEHFAPIFREMSTVQTFRNPSLYEAYANMAYGEKANLGQANNNRCVRPRRTKHIESKYNLYTFITMPIEELVSDEQKTRWCNNATEKLITSITTTVSGAYFKAAMTSRADEYKNPHLKTVVEESNHFSIQRYLEYCYVSTRRIEKISKYMSVTVANDIMTHLWQNQRVQNEAQENDKDD